MVKHFRDYFKWIKKQKKLNKNSKCIEIGSMMGHYLKILNYDINCLGIEPSKNVALYAKKRNLSVLNKFFCFKEVAKLKKYIKKLT